MMAKRKRKAASKSSKQAQGCFAFLVLAIIAGVVGFANQNKSSNRATPVQRAAATSVPTAGDAINTNTANPAPTLARTATNVPVQLISTATVAVAQNTATQASGVEVMSPTSYTTTGAANLRSCAGTDCNVAGQLATGAVVMVNGRVEGQAVNAGNATWYTVDYNGQVAYIYSGVVSVGVQNAPVQQQQASPQQQASGNTQRPGNCATAVAMGLSAEEAGKWPHLDRDDDKVACYGD